MRIDISLRGLTDAEMENWLGKYESYTAAHRSIESSVRYGNDWEGEVE